MKNFGSSVPMGGDPLLFGRGEQFAIAHDASRSVGMVGIDPED